MSLNYIKELMYQCGKGSLSPINHSSLKMVISPSEGLLGIAPYPKRIIPILSGISNISLSLSNTSLVVIRTIEQLHIKL